MSGSRALEHGPAGLTRCHRGTPWRSAPPPYDCRWKVLRSWSTLSVSQRCWSWRRVTTQRGRGGSLLQTRWKKRALKVLSPMWWTVRVDERRWLVMLLPNKSRVQLPVTNISAIICYVCIDSSFTTFFILYMTEIGHKKKLKKKVLFSEAFIL